LDGTFTNLITTGGSPTQARIAPAPHWGITVGGGRI